MTVRLFKRWQRNVFGNHIKLKHGKILLFLTHDCSKISKWKSRNILEFFKAYCKRTFRKSLPLNTSFFRYLTIFAQRGKENDNYYIFKTNFWDLFTKYQIWSNNKTSDETSYPRVFDGLCHFRKLWWISRRLSNRRDGKLIRWASRD